MKRTGWRKSALSVGLPMMFVMGHGMATTQRTEFERFREYVLNPQFVAIETTEAALMQTATGQITTQARGYVTTASAPGSFVVTVLEGGTWTQLTSLGPILTERGRTTSLTPPEIEELKPRRFCVGLYYSYADFKEFDGKDINSLFKGPVVTTTSTLLTSSTDRIAEELREVEDFDERLAFLNACWGDKPNFDVATQKAHEIGLPSFKGRRLVGTTRTEDGDWEAYILEEKHEHLRQVAEATFRIRTHTATALANFVATDWLDLTALIPVHSIDWDSDVFREYYVDGVLQERTHAHFGDSATGLGDITLRSKARLTRQGAAVDCAAALGLRLPTGDEDEFLGTGSLGVNPLFMVSKEVGRFAPYINVGYLFDTEDSDWSRWELKAALDFTPIAGRLTIGAEFIGFIYDDFNIYDAGVAVKCVPLGARPLALGASVLFPVNDDGLRPDYVGVFGAEYCF